MSVGLLLWYDGSSYVVARHVSGIVAHEAGVVVVASSVDDFDPVGLEEPLRDVGGGTVVPVVHVADLEADHDEPAGRRYLDVDEAHRRLTTRFPAATFHHWGLLLVGRELDPDEVEHVRLLGAQAQAGLVRGVLVAASSSDASVAHTEDEQRGFAADAAIALLTSPLPDRIERARMWAVGASSVHYRPATLQSAASSELAVELLDAGLLSEPPLRDPHRDIGERWLLERGLAEDAEADQLRRDSSGGVVGARLRVDGSHLDQLDFHAWPTAIRSYRDQLVMTRLPLARDQISRNVEHRRGQLLEIIESAAVQILRESGRFASARRWLSGVADGLSSVEASLLEQRARLTRQMVDLTVRHDELVRAVKWLPYAWGLAVRAAVLAIAVALVTSELIPALAPDLVAAAGSSGWATFLRWLPRLLAAVVLIVAFVQHSRAAARVWAARDDYLASIAEDLRLQLERHLLDRRIAAVRELRGLVAGDAPDSLVGRIDRSIAEVQDARDALTDLASRRAEPELLQTRFSVGLPTTADVPATDLLREISETERDHLARVVTERLTRSLDVTSDEVQAIGRELVQRSLRELVWPDLADLVRSDRPTRATARALLAAPTTPRILSDRSDRHHELLAGREQLVLHGGDASPVLAPLASLEVAALNPAREETATPVGPTTGLVAGELRGHIAKLSLMRIGPLLDADTRGSSEEVGGTS